MTLTEKIKQKALQLGFDLVGVTDASPVGPEHVDRLKNWLNSGHAAQMSYMQKNLEKRTDPAKLFSPAKSVICTALNYKPPKTKFEPPKNPTGKVATYAQYEDYHTFIKQKLRLLADFIATLAGPDFKFKICADSAPLAERALAQRAGLGFIGKNHILINPTLGPQLLLGELITNLQLQTDTPLAADCKACNKCLDACPTKALQPDGTFDANKCISYLTIEHKGDIPPQLAEKIADRLFGCDTCLLACPYSDSTPLCSDTDFKFHPERENLTLDYILNLTQEKFDSDFADSPMTRTTLNKLKSTAKICLENIKSQIR
ncbi:MAG: tRNA epoxyqueuosine(34) reductase QueG [Sedimentisphaerales bacterium]|jgi:epoxyqueuosine reductase|nr:tRNA epoxyqueuosine(34) reductase QueG [Sedimentisphaerales bacterium]